MCVGYFVGGECVRFVFELLSFQHLARTLVQERQGETMKRVQHWWVSKIPAEMCLVHSGAGHLTKTLPEISLERVRRRHGTTIRRPSPHQRDHMQVAYWRDLGRCLGMQHWGHVGDVFYDEVDDVKAPPRRGVMPARITSLHISKCAGKEAGLGELYPTPSRRSRLARALSIVARRFWGAQ